MAKLELSGWDAGGELNEGYNPNKLTSPMVFFWIMVFFLIIVGFVGAILFRQAHAAFMSNPGLNGLILGVLLIGILLVFNHVLGLRPEVRWFNSFRAAGSAEKVGRDPVLLAPMRALIGQRHSMAISTTALRSILDSIATRLDESRDTSRYLIGLWSSSACSVRSGVCSGRSDRLTLSSNRSMPEREARRTCWRP